MKTIHYILQNSTIDLFDAKMLLAHTLGVEISTLSIYDENIVTDAQYTTYQNYINRRIKGEPVDLIMGWRGFYTGEFKITADVLSPRPDTECIIDGILDRVDKNSPLRILDLGTGSGCILISLLMGLPNATGIGVDISEKALEIATFNAEYNGVGDRTDFIQSNWFENVQGTYDIIVSNPPYIPSAVIDTLQVEVKQYDPILALDGGSDGLAPYRIIANNAETYLNENGIIVIEFGYNQSQDIQNIFEKDKKYKVYTPLNDLAQILRGLYISRF